MQRLAETSSETALACLECVIYIYKAHNTEIPWRLAYSLYLRAERSACEHTLETIQQLPFVSYLSRACRGCGKRTQRNVCGTLLCGECTKNDGLYYAWMVPAQVAVALGVHNVRKHRGARCELVFASDITRLGKKSRAKIKRTIKSVLRKPRHGR